MNSVGTSCGCLWFMKTCSEPNGECMNEYILAFMENKVAFKKCSVFLVILMLVTQELNSVKEPKTLNPKGEKNYHLNSGSLLPVQ